VEEADWERRLAKAWASIDQRGEAEFLALIGRLAAELPPDSAVAAFERAASLDSTGHADLAVPLYRQALDRGLTGERRRRAVIQLASSLRNLGQPQQSVALLRAELMPAPTTWTTRSARSSRWPWWTSGASGRRSRWR
jgi:hypothetical protein